MKVAGLVLAAGAGTRLGAPKALLRLGDQTLAERAVGTLREGGCDPVIIVVGAGLVSSASAEAPADAEAPAEAGVAASAGVVASAYAVPDAEVVVNAEWETGMGSSLRAGLAALSEVDADAVVVTLVDMPGVSAEAVRRVIQRASPTALVMAGYDERRGHPVLFGRDHWAGIAASAVGDMGARSYLRARESEVEVVACQDVASDEDIDTADDARRWHIRD